MRNLDSGTRVRDPWSCDPLPRLATARLLQPERIRDWLSELEQTVPASPYREVSMAELSRNVGKRKLDVLEELISAIRTSHDEIDTWIVAAEQATPASDGPETARGQ
ncbi:hypothetical protein ACWCQ1_34500 [Streptomyces sp. NPDC002144]